MKVSNTDTDEETTQEQTSSVLIYLPYYLPTTHCLPRLKLPSLISFSCCLHDDLIFQLFGRCLPSGTFTFPIKRTSCNVFKM